MLKELVQATLHRLGYELKRFRPSDTDAGRLVAMLDAHDVNLVLDVGANIGQFGIKLREIGYTGRIVSFEPLSAARDALAKAGRNDPQWELADQAAIGSEDSEIEIHIASNSSSSSPLRMLETHLSAAPESRYIGTERVPLRRLDSLASGYLRQDSVAFLKIDTQGYEDRVLEGASETLGRVVGLQLELSLVPLYEGQRLADEMTERVKKSGFEIWALSPVLIDSRTGRTLQVDATFFRP
jgi:FkbM family methyltransferase